MKTLQLLFLCLIALLVLGGPLLAQTPGTEVPGHNLAFAGAGVGAGVGAALTIVGAGIGFGRIGAAALESMARQPEVAKQVNNSMIILAALLEGVTLFALVICIVVALQAKF